MTPIKEPLVAIVQEYTSQFRDFHISEWKAFGARIVATLDLSGTRPEYTAYFDAKHWILPDPIIAKSISPKAREVGLGYYSSNSSILQPKTFEEFMELVQEDIESMDKNVFWYPRPLEVKVR